MNDSNIILGKALVQIPRILGFLDTDTNSKTHGCFDRYYWHYKILDFPNARFQEAVLTLAILYDTNLPDNPYFRSSLIYKWCTAGIKFWRDSRNKDGSTNESYPNEHHFCSTALSLYAISEAMLILKGNSFNDLLNTGDFISRYNNYDVANQMAGSAAALYNLYLMCGKEKYRKAYENKIEGLMDMRDKNGFFMEYGGFDLGYNTITLSFLASLYKKTNNSQIFDMGVKCAEGIDSFIDNDGYYGYDNMSRKTQFVYPSGFIVFKTSVIDKIANGLSKNVILNPGWMDDRYSIPLASDYLKAYINLSGS